MQVNSVKNFKNQKYSISMMVILWSAIAYFMLCHSSNQLIAQSEWTLEEVLLIASDQSVFRYQADADNLIAQSNWKFFKANLSPRIGLDILAPNYIKTSREITQPDGSIAFQSVTQNNSSINIGVEQRLKSTGGTLFLNSQLQRFDNFSLDNKQYNGIPIRLGLVQPLFAFNDLKWSSEIEPLVLKEADRKYLIDMEDIHLRATIQYFNLLTAQLEESIAQTNSDVNRKLLEIAQERFNLGKISRNELLQLNLEYKSALKDLTLAQFQVEFSVGSLFAFLGRDENKDLRVRNPEPLSTAMLVDRKKALEQARANRPEVIAFERQRKEADRDIRKAQADFGIKADLVASFGFAKGSPQLVEVYSQPFTQQQVQLSISVPILDWGRRKSAVGIAEASKELVLQQVAQDEINFNNDILQVINRWEQIQQEISLQAEIQDVSLERFEISRQRYILGDISITDLTIAQREKDQAQRTYLDTLQSYWITYYQIRKLTVYDFLQNNPIIIQ